MNVTPGEMILLANSNSNQSWRYSRMNSSASNSTAISERCYENLDPGQQQQLQQLVNSTSSHVIASGARVTGGRHSRPDIFSKVDLPLLDSNGALRMSEPCTPTSAAAGLLMGQRQLEQRKVNYIVLDLDSVGSSGSSKFNNNNNNTDNNSSNSSGPNGTMSSASVSVLTTSTTTPGTYGGGGAGGGGGHSSSSGSGGVGGSASVSNLLNPDSPKRREPLGYATIDFNKTVALSNSTNPTCDSEASRKTRF